MFFMNTITLVGLKRVTQGKKEKQKTTTTSSIHRSEHEAFPP
jgi:hypothetical protein